MGGGVAHAGSLEDYPLVIATVEPKEITVKKGSSTEVLVNLTYVFKPVFDAPEQVTVEMIKPKGQFVPLQATLDMSPEERNKRAKDVFYSGKSDPAFFEKSRLVSYTNSGHIELDAGETKTVKMRITIPGNFPDELLDQKMIVTPGFSVDSKMVKGMVLGTEVLIVE